MHHSVVRRIQLPLQPKTLSIIEAQIRPLQTMLSFLANLVKGDIIENQLILQVHLLE